ncbi:MAG: helix-turn-helix domain-containing protein [Thalassotalea sp.]
MKSFITEEYLLSQLLKIKEASSIGRSSNLIKLLAYLVSKEINNIDSSNVLYPKELEIAMNVFGKTAEFNSSEDASVRVHISRLRKKLAEYYLNEGKNETHYIEIPVGEYRLEVIKNESGIEPHLASLTEPHLKPNIQPHTAETINNIAPKNAINSLLNHYPIIAIGFCLLTLALHFFMLSDGKLKRPLSAQVTNSPIWDEYIKPNHKNIIVLGDNVEDFVNDNSTQGIKNDSNNGISKSLTLALKNILSLSDNFRFTPVIFASELTINDIKQANIIYIGHFNNMGILSNYFKASKFDYAADKQYLAVKNSNILYPAPENIQNKYNDYGLFAKVDGPRKNKIYIIAGYTDSSLLWLSWFLTSDNKSSNNEFEHSINSYPINNSDNVELLFKISSINGEDIGHKLISSSPIKSKIIWNSP